MFKEKVVIQRFEGITRYRIGANSPLERPTHWCSSLADVLDALKAQKQFFTKQGATIISQRIMREDRVELKQK